jgi:hypothetical protein
MATLPQTSRIREPLTTLVTELYGDQTTPALQPSADRRASDDHWQDAVTQVGEQLRAKLRVDVLPERLNKALALVLAHAVTLHADGTASVQSGQQTYTLAPECLCADATHRTEFCKHHLAVELHRRALALRDGTATVAANGTPFADAPRSLSAPDAAPSALASAAWDVHEAPTSSCFKIRVGTLEWTHTIRASDDTELHTRLQAFLPTFRDIAAALEALHAEREAAKAAPGTPAPQPPAPPAARPEADLHALIQQAVQQALAAQASHGTATAHGTATSTPPSAPPSTAPEESAGDDQETGLCSLHEVDMKAHADPTTGDRWYSHWDAEEQRYCRGRSPRRARASRR